MRTIKVFLASSIKEFANERISLKNFVRQMANVLIDHDVYLKMFICEYADNAIADGRKQDEFSREIDDSDIFLIIVGRHIGEYTLEEYQYALDIQNRRGDGKIMACFKICEDTTVELINFKENLSAASVKAEFSEIAELKSAFASVIGEMLGDTVLIEAGTDSVSIAGKIVRL
jgi:hypothetical protein